MRNHRWRAASFRPVFEMSVIKTVERYTQAEPTGLGYGGKAGLTETDLMLILRGGWRGPGSVDGISWSFGPYDFRSIIGGMVSDGRLIETMGQERGGGRETRYRIPTTTDRALAAQQE